MSVGVVGLGLIGGSFDRAVHAYTEHRVYALDADPAVLQAAQAEGVVHGALTDARLRDLDVLILALYPQQIADFLTANAAKIAPGTLVFDCGGTKELVCNTAFPLARQYGFDFLGGHPMAGIEKSGFSWSKQDLFQGASMIFVPPENGDAVLARAGDFVRRLGFGRITVTTAAEHDRTIAYTSQLAHVVSSAYIKSPTAQNFVGFSAGSFRDMTRVAFLNETMWTELFLENRTYLKQEIDEMISHLHEYADAIGAADEQRLFQLLRDGRLRKLQSDTAYGQK